MISQARGESEIMDALSSSVDAIVMMLSSILPSETLHLLPRGTQHPAFVRATLDATAAQIDQIHNTFDKIVQRGSFAVAAARRRLNVACSPIYTLPMEILSNIFRQAVICGDDVPIGKKAPINVTLVLRLSIVSHSWRSNILGLTDLFTESPDWDLWPSWLCNEWYERSQGRPIAVSIGQRFLNECITFHGELSKSMKLLRSFTPRISTVMIEGPLNEGLETKWPARDFVAGLSLSSITSLVLKELRDTIYIPSRVLQALRSLSLHNSFVKDFGPSSQWIFPSLEHFFFTFNDASFPQWESIVYASPRLRTITFCAGSTECRLPHERLLPIRMFPLPSVEVLTFTCLEMDDVCLVLNCWSLPNARTVILEDIREYNSSLQTVDIINSLGRAAPNLKHLNIRNYRSYIEEAIDALVCTADSECALPSLTEMSLYGYLSEGDPLLPDPDRSTMDTRLVRLVLSRRLKLLRLFFAPLERTVNQLRKHVDTLDVVESEILYSDSDIAAEDLKNSSSELPDQEVSF
ncbi:hypothetical protein DL93DRAFT_2227136 [Clavulina sp. PMI_390]|nr:hypothetical protein DL93DRAFT_2227136 [Clavulina sp. PMI_390]